MTGAASNRRGSKAERAVILYLRAHGFPHVERKGKGLPGADVAELGPGLELDVKDRTRLRFGEWLDQLTATMVTTEAEMGAVIAKRAGTINVGSWYFIQTQALFRHLVDLDEATLDRVVRIARLDTKALPRQLDGAIEASDGWVPWIWADRRGHPPSQGYAVTTVGHGVRLLRQAGWGDPLG